MKKLRNKSGKSNGFTLAELLIVVAIIAVLVAIAIPIFTTQLEKSREATDAANIRSAYADAMSQYLLNQTSAVSSDDVVKIKQKDATWSNTDIDWSWYGASAPTIEVGASYKVTLTPDASDATKDPTISLTKQGS